MILIWVVILKILRSFVWIKIWQCICLAHATLLWLRFHNALTKNLCNSRIGDNRALLSDYKIEKGQDGLVLGTPGTQLWPCQHEFTWWRHQMETFSFVRGIHRSPVNSPHKGQWRGALMFSLISAWINCWVNNRELVIWDAHSDVTIMVSFVTHGGHVGWHGTYPRLDVKNEIVGGRNISHYVHILR